MVPDAFVGNGGGQAIGMGAFEGAGPQGEQDGGSREGHGQGGEDRLPVM